MGLDFDEDEFLAELNKRIAEEGKFPERVLAPSPTDSAAGAVLGAQNGPCCELVGLFHR